MDERPVLSLGLAPALQRTLSFARFELDEVNRAQRVTLSAAGKAVNVGLALAVLGDPVQVTGFNGGATGRLLARDLHQRGVAPRFCSLRAPTRICTTALDEARGWTTELVEEAPTPDAVAWRRFARINLRLVPRCRLLAISGTLPPGTPDDFYVPFVQAATRRAQPVVIDSHRAGLLATLPLRPMVAKLNVHELELTWGRGFRTERALLAGAFRLAQAGAQWVLLTHGAQPGYLLSADGRAWRLVPPPVARVVNPIGSGDCTTAGVIHAWLRGRAMPEAARFGMGCGAANVANVRPADFTSAQARRLAAAAGVEPIDWNPRKAQR